MRTTADTKNGVKNGVSNGGVDTISKKLSWALFAVAFLLCGTLADCLVARSTLPVPKRIQESLDPAICRSNGAYFTPGLYRWSRGP